MPHVVVVRAAGDDRPRHLAGRDSLALDVRLDALVNGYGAGVGRHALANVLGSHGLALSPAVWDLATAAAGAYCADLVVPRSSGFDGWTRDIVLELPVTDVGRWHAAESTLGRLLAFLTGDRWQIRLTETERPPDLRPRGRRAAAEAIAADTVVLFSGGLDSYIGAVDFLAAGARPVLLGHYKGGEGATSMSQRRAYEALRARGDDQPPYLQVWLSPPSGRGQGSETTTRGRSLIFLALGASIASALGARLVVPENGFISLNVPLDASRAGTLSTRTTHPHLIALFRRLLDDLGLAVPVELPYRFRTKGEMLRACADQDTLRAGVPETMSCAHPSGRFARLGNVHCGYCVACLIRRAAVQAWGGPDVARYRLSLVEAAAETGAKAADLRAVRAALDRFGRRPPTLTDLLTAGPLPGTPDEQRAYGDVFRRGLGELDSLVRGLG